MDNLKRTECKNTPLQPGNKITHVNYFFPMHDVFTKSGLMIVGAADAVNMPTK